MDRSSIDCKFSSEGSSESTPLLARAANCSLYSWADRVPSSCAGVYLWDVVTTWEIMTATSHITHLIATAQSVSIMWSGTLPSAHCCRNSPSCKRVYGFPSQRWKKMSTSFRTNCSSVAVVGTHAGGVETMTMADGDGSDISSGGDTAWRFLDAVLLVLLGSVVGDCAVPFVPSFSPSRFSRPSIRFKSSSNTSVLGPRFLGTASSRHDSAPCSFHKAKF
jgi:hypothetical protein